MVALSQEKAPWRNSAGMELVVPAKAGVLAMNPHKSVGSKHQIKIRRDFMAINGLVFIAVSGHPATHRRLMRLAGNFNSAFPFVEQKPPSGVVLQRFVPVSFVEPVDLWPLSLSRPLEPIVFWQLQPAEMCNNSLACPNQYLEAERLAQKAR